MTLILNWPARRLHVVHGPPGPGRTYVQVIYIDGVAIDFVRVLASLAIIHLMYMYAGGPIRQ